ncbi:hypothetical protein [Halococcoides cellulosivorans]|uniref:Uncharacterized protein n=1 Tax=Halococcoides cellulosivorans TaxID=1679096 RepID=A0A2R4X3X4_9EURY|nr:hypothetical protein [Halococcoides cellulosivorans]AWB28490.1 hypothetical protein HARCEL1_12660 [Halococcoides cellulosivorans]
MVLPDPGTLQDAARHAERVAEEGIDTSNAKALAKMRNALKRLEDAAQDARKGEIEPALDEEVDVGDNVGDVVRVTQSRSTVTDTEAALEMLEDADADPGDLMRIYVGRFRDAVNGSDSDPSEVIEDEEYTCYHRTGDGSSG